MICKFCGKKTNMTVRDSNGNLMSCCKDDYLASQSKSNGRLSVSVIYKDRDKEKEDVLRMDI